MSLHERYRKNAIAIANDPSKELNIDNYIKYQLSLRSKVYNNGIIGPRYGYVYQIGGKMVTVGIIPPFDGYWYG